MRCGYAVLSDGNASALDSPVAQDGNGKTRGVPPPFTSVSENYAGFSNKSIPDFFAFTPTGMEHSGWGLAAARKADAAEAVLSLNVLRVYEPVARARRLRFCLSASGVTELQVAEGTFAVPTKEGWHGACPSLIIQASAVTEANVP